MGKLYNYFWRHYAGYCRIPVFVAGFSFLCSCSVGTLFREELKKEEAMVMLSDKTVHTGRALLPDYKNEHFRFVTEDGRRLRIHSSEVGQLRFSRGKILSGIFIYSPYVDRSGRQRNSAWMNCYGQGRHLRLALLGENWRFDRNGKLEPVSFSDGDVYIIGIKEDGMGHYISCFGHSRNMMIRALCKFLSDDPKLCEQIASKEVDVFDFTEICRRYVPKEDGRNGNYQVKTDDAGALYDDGTKGGWL